MNKMLFLLAGLLVFLGCKNDEKDFPVDKALTYKVSLNLIMDTDSAILNVTATALNVKLYRLISGAGDTVSNKTGKFKYVYKKSGDFKVSVLADILASESFRKDTTFSIKLNKQIDQNIGKPNKIPIAGYSTPQTYEGMTLLWSDEFENTTLDNTKWTHETGRGSNGWGNNELQYYRSQNTTIQDGILTIEAKKEDYMGAQYTSSRMITKDKFDFKYGRVDIRASLPNQKGLWPALWMLGANFPSTSWPTCGEIDIMELIGGGKNASKVFGTYHWANSEGNHVCNCGDKDKNTYTLAEGDYSDKWYVFSIDWTEKGITWYMNDKKFAEIFFNTTTQSGHAAFQKNFFLIFNVAVGGNLPGPPDQNSIFPQRMYVDYIRVFQKN